MVLTILVLLGAQEIPKTHDSPIPSRCRRCSIAYEKAIKHTVQRLPQARYPTKMIMGWVLLADGRYPKEAKRVLDEALLWDKRVGPKEPHNHRRNWYPTLAGIFIAEYAKHHPSRDLIEAMDGIVKHFALVQERTGGWYKWHEGAYKDRLDYPAKDLGMLDSMIFGFLWSARTHGVKVPAETLQKADDCLEKLLSGRGISYGTPQRGGDPTGARGAFAMLGLYYSQNQKHRIATTYKTLLPQQIPNLDQGHHVGGLHCLGVVLGCRLLGRTAYRKLTDAWLDRLIDKQEADGGVYVGDDGDAGGEVGLLGEDDASTGAFALMILLQDPSRLQPAVERKIDWTAFQATPPKTRSLAKAAKLAAGGKLKEILRLADSSLARKRASDEEKAEADRLKKEVERHAKRRFDEAEALVKELELLKAIEIFEALKKALDRKHEIALACMARLKEIKDDKKLQHELKAGKEFRKAWTMALRAGLGKTSKSFERLIGKYPDTRAAARAKEILGKP